VTRRLRASAKLALVLLVLNEVRGLIVVAIVVKAWLAHRTL